MRQVTELYRNLIPPGGTVLDLCSSWVSHLPPEVSYERVVGHGMSAAELARNPRLDSFFVRNLNTDPDGWAAADNSFDAVTCCVSIQVRGAVRCCCCCWLRLRPSPSCMAYCACHGGCGLRCGECLAHVAHVRTRSWRL